MRHKTLVTVEKPVFAIKKCLFVYGKKLFYPKVDLSPSVAWVESRESTREV